ncbi:MAG: hypothetical protein HY323_07345 [Betaproteobacteria bacterium]|nr:hypothetical protein [Betaproteobacteria bacterium]
MAFAVEGTELFSRKTPGGVYTIASVTDVPGKIFYVDGNHANKGDTVGHGRSPDLPFATLAYAFSSDLLTAGQRDVVLVAPGHSETLTAAIAADIAGVRVIGSGDGSDRPQITLNGNVDGVSITAANIVFKNFLFNEATAAHAATGLANIAAADVLFDECEFNQGASDLLGVTLTAAAERVRFRRCIWRVTANGPDCGVKIEGVIDNPVVEDCLFVGSDGTNPYDDGCINNDSVATTNLNIRHCRFHGNGQTVVALANTTNMVGNAIGPNSYDANVADQDNNSENASIGAANDTTTDSLHGKIGTDTEMADVSLYDMLGGPNGATTESINGKLGTDTELADRSLYDIVNGGGPAAAAAAAAPANDVSLYAAVRHIVENLLGGAEAATTDLIAGKLGTDTELADRSLYDQINGAGPAAAAAAAAPGNDVSLYAAVRHLSEKQGWRPLMGNWDFATDAGAAGAFTVFTVTGVVEVQVFGVCNTNAITAGGAVTLELGVAGNTAVLIAQIADARDLIANEVWVDATPTTTVEPWDADAKTFILTNGQDIIQTIGVGGLTGGTIDYYLMWRPRSADGAIVAA